MSKENLLWMLLGMNLAFSIVSLYNAIREYPNISPWIWVHFFGIIILIVCLGWFTTPRRKT